MVKHVILWKLKDELVGEEKAKVVKGIKERLYYTTAGPKGKRKSQRRNSSGFL